VPLTAKGRKIITAMEREYGSKRGKSIFYASRNKHRISGVDPESSHDAAPASRLSYYASLLPGKESQFQTPEGYRIYKDVPICRTGSQQYLGREIKKNPGYKAEWGIGDDELVTVYRPIEEVTAPETIASFEGKSVLDEHPADPKILVDALDEYEATSKGHAQNVRVGENLEDGEFAGETPLLADLHVKHPDLNVKVDDGVREVSCGYTFRLDKDSSGRYIQRQIRGNHVAIVPKGRAGADVGIKDAAPKSFFRRIEMKSLRTLIGLGLQAALRDAKPDEVAGIVDAALEEDKEEKKGEKDCMEDKAKDRKRGTKDAKTGKLAELRKLLDEYLEEEEDEPEHAAMDKKKGKAKDADEFGDDEMNDAEDESEEKEDKEREKQSKEAEKDKKGSKDEKGAIVLPADEHSESNFSTGDAASLVSMLRPLVARSGDKAAKDAFSAFSRKVKAAQAGAKDAAADPFALLANITADGAAADSEPEIPMYTFFNGKSHADGLKAWNEYQAAHAARK
jgi:hypothetical protein